MIAVAAHTDPEIRSQLFRVLKAAGWTVHGTEDPDHAVDECRRAKCDVLFVEAGLPGGEAPILDRVKRDADLFRTAVVLIATEPVPADVVAWLARGADDVLRLPLQDGDVVGRAFAAARTKALVKELTGQNDRMEELVLFDELTGLRNRRAVLNELELVLAAASRHGHALSVLMLDVDRFKPINDRHGHRAGDEVLREVSRRLRSRLRKQDLGGRIGGDELIVVLPSTDAEGATVAAEAIRSAISGRPVRTSAGPIDVTVSIGSATWADEDVTSLLERADRALYQAKTSGRDRATAA